MTWLVEKFRRRAQERAIREDAPYPMHARTLGFLGSRQEPITIFVCNNDHPGIGDPWREPDRGCAECDLGTWHDGEPFAGLDGRDPGAGRRGGGRDDRPGDHDPREIQRAMGEEQTMTWDKLRRVDDDPGWVRNDAQDALRAKYGLPIGDSEVWVSRKYQVLVNYLKTEDPSLPSGRDGMMHLSIHAHDRSRLRDWRHLQSIKNDVAGEDRTAVEVFPPEQFLVDTSNEYHLYVMPVGTNLAFAFQERLVSNGEQTAAYNAAPHKGRQAPFEPGLSTGPRPGEHDDRLDVG